MEILNNPRHLPAHILMGAACIAAAAVFILSGSICAFAETTEEETGYAIAVIPSRKSVESYTVIRSGEELTLSREEASQGSTYGPSDTSSYASTPVEESMTTVTDSLAVYEAPIADAAASAGTWEESTDQNGNTVWRYLGSDGVSYASHGWAYIGDELSYLTRDGYWYHFDENGFLTSGWLCIGETWYHTSELHDGSYGMMSEGFYTDDDGVYTYYFDPDTGKMLSGWQKIDTYWYYFAESFDAEYLPCTYNEASGEWIYDNTLGRTYGSMYKNERTPDGWYADRKGKVI